MDVPDEVAPVEPLVPELLDVPAEPLPDGMVDDELPDEPMPDELPEVEPPVVDGVPVDELEEPMPDVLPEVDEPDEPMLELLLGVDVSRADGRAEPLMEPPAEPMPEADPEPETLGSELQAARAAAQAAAMMNLFMESPSCRLTRRAECLWTRCAQSAALGDV